MPTYAHFSVNGILTVVQKHAALHDLAGVNQDQEKLKKEIEDTYGAININLEDGTYTEVENNVE